MAPSTVNTDDEIIHIHELSQYRGSGYQSGFDISNNYAFNYDSPQSSIQQHENHRSLTLVWSMPTSGRNETGRQLK